MAMTGENQVRNIFVGATYPDHATMIALKAGTIGDLAVLESDGTAPAAGKEFIISQKNYKGEITTSDKIHPSRVTYAKSTKYAARVEPVWTVSGIASATGSDLYTVVIPIEGYGSLSTENEYVKEGFYKSTTGDDAETIVDGLVKSLYRNFSRDEPKSADTVTYTLKGGGTVVLPQNNYFTFTKTGATTTAALVITAKSTWLPKYYVTGRKTRLSMDFKVNVKFPGANTVTNSTVGKLGSGTGYQVRNMEEYLLGNRQDTFRGAGYPHNFPEHYDSVLTGAYHLIDIEYYDEGRDDPMKSKKQLTICLPDVGADTGNDIEYTTVNALIADLNTAIAGANGVVISAIAPEIGGGL